MSDRHEELERFIDRTLRAQPHVRAPVSLESRVLEELRQRAALAWWRRGFAHWPVFARAAFILLSIAFAKLAIEGVMWLATLATRPVEWVRDTARPFFVVAQAAETVVASIPSAWLYLTLFFIAVAYASLFGIGAATYRAIFK